MRAGRGCDILMIWNEWSVILDNKRSLCAWRIFGISAWSGMTCIWGKNECYRHSQSLTVPVSDEKPTPTR